MPDIGEECLILGEALALSDVAPSDNEETVLYTESKSRGESSPAVGAEVAMVAEGLGQSLAASASGDFAVTIQSTNSPVVETNTLSVSADVTNNQSTSQDGTIILQIDGDTKATTEVSIAGGATEQVVLTWDTAEGDAGDYTASVASGTDSDSTSVTIEEKNETPTGDFSITITDSNSPVAAGALAHVSVDVTNNLNSEQDGNIVFTTDGVYRDNRTITVPAGETYEMSLFWDTTTDDAGSYTAKVESGTDYDTTPLEVESVANIEEKTFDATTSVTLAEDPPESSNNEFVTVEENLSDVRFIRAAITFQQQGEYISNNAYVSLNIPSKEGDQLGIQNDDWNVLVAKGSSFGHTGRFDLGEVQSGDLSFGVDEGEGTYSPPE